MKKSVLIICIAAVLAFAIGFGAVAIVMSGNKNQPSTGEGQTNTTGNNTEGVVLDLKNFTESIAVTQRSFYPDNNELFEKLNLIQYGIKNGKFDDKTLASELESALRELEQLGFYYDYIDKTSIKAEDGTVYGASGDERGPIGGGDGYKDIFKTGDYVVYDDNTFYNAVKNAKSGEVIFIKHNTVIDISDLKITEYPNLQIKEGVTIASDRGYNGSGGGVLKFSLHLSLMFKTHHNVRITGLVLQGTDATTHEGEDKYSSTVCMTAQGDNLEIDNCEISGFNAQGIATNVGTINIHHCYIHHIRGDKQGNGITVTKANVKIEHNLFSNCYSCITMSGATAGSFEAYNNVEVGNSTSSMFTIKASTISSTEIEGMKRSGTSVIIKNNTVLGTTQPIVILGMPDSMVVENNIFSLNENQYNLDGLYGEAAYRDKIKEYITFQNNVFNILNPVVKDYCVATKTVASADSEE